MNVLRDPHSEEIEAPRPLLCAVDQSIEAREVADVAASLAARLDAPLVLAHVLTDRPAGPRSSAIHVEHHGSDELEAARLLLERIISASAPDRQPRVRLAFGDPCERVIEFGDEEDAQILIVGSRGRGSVQAAILGGVSSRLAARAARPVLVVPPDAAREFRRGLSERAPSVVCGVDGSREAQFAARHAAALAAQLGMRLVLINAYGDHPRGVGVARSGALPHHGVIALESDRRSGRDILDRTAQLVRSDLEIALGLHAGDPAAVLQRRAAHERAALIVTGSRGRGALTSALLGSVSSRLAAGAGRPVMVVSTAAADTAARLPTERPMSAQAR